MKYKILEGITTADVAYKVYGETLEELFTNAAEAVTSTMVDISMIEPLHNLELKTQNLELEELLLDFLNELVFLKDSKQMFFSRFDIKLKKLNAKHYSLNANLRGEKIDPERHKLKVDVKAVTRHKFSLENKKNQYVAQIVLDI